MTGWAAREADKRAQRGRFGHGTACGCLRCVGRDAYVAETQRLKAHNDARGFPAFPPGWQAMRRRFKLVTPS